MDEAASTEPLLSIVIPCYRQLAFATRCLESVLRQSFSGFEVILLDDGDSADYRRHVESLGDPRVQYRRNDRRLGAIGNIFQSVYLGSRKYVLAFHEDDLLGEHYVAAAIGILESHPECLFVAGELHEFDTEPPAGSLTRRADHPAYDLYKSGADFLRGVFRGVEPMFGSVVYRRSGLDSVKPEIGTLGTLCDRPFLLEILRNGSGAVLREPLVWYRLHGSDDDRHRSLTAEQILQFLRIYRSTMPERWSLPDQVLFYSYAGYWLFELYALVPRERRPSLRRFVLRAWREGVYEPRWLGRSGYRRLVRVILGKDKLS